MAAFVAMLESWRTRLMAAGLSLYAAALALRPLDEADAFFHLSLGRAVLAAGSRTVPEPTAFADFTEPAVAAEWAWSVLNYALYRLGGWNALSVLVVLLAPLIAYGLVRLVRAYARPAPLVWQLSVCTLVVCALQPRIALRPQLMLLAGLAPFLLGARAYAQASLPRRAALGALLVAAVTVWAQFHGSFVLAPLLFVIQVARAPVGPDGRRLLRLDAGVFALSLLALSSSAYGADIALFITSHAAGDAPRYVAEMARPTWAMLEPFGAPSNLAFWLLMALGAAGMLVARRWFWRETLLLALGIALLSTANRFLSEAALLAAPWAARGCSALAVHWTAAQPRPRALALAGYTLCAALLGWSAVFIHQARGPLARAGLLTSAFPVYAAPALAALPDRSAVLTDYPSSAALGFFSSGRLRSYVDGRTPLYFDDSDFAVQREMMRDGAALERGIQRFGARAALVRRDSEACVQLAKRWPVVLIEPLFSTFAPAPSAPLTAALRPCGVRYLSPEACQDPIDLANGIARVRAAGARDFARYLEAERTARCGGDAAAAMRTLVELDSGARPYRRAFRRTQAELSLALGRFEEASAILQRALREDDPAILNILLSTSGGGLPLRDASRVLTTYLDLARDDADLISRVALAEICSQTGDYECMRFHATRAAVRGRDSVALHQLAQRHPDERVRRDARAWIELLKKRNESVASP